MGVVTYTYALEKPVTAEEVREKLQARSGLAATIQPGVGEGEFRLVVPELGDWAVLTVAPTSLRVAFGSVPPSPFFTAHLEAAVASLGGKRTTPIHAPPAPLASSTWQELGWFEQLQLRSGWGRLLRPTP